MQILRLPHGDQSARNIQLEHDGEILQFNVGYATNIGSGLKGEVMPNGRDFYRLVRDVNAYWATVPIHVQNQIFDCYKKMHLLFAEIADAQMLLVALRKEVAKLMALHPYDEVEAFVKSKGTVKYPHDLKREYGIGAPESPLTYLRPDYESLMAFAILVRISLPIIGEFISKTSKIIDTNQKEIIACRIFSSSQLVHTVPYIKLQTYMETYVRDQTMTMAAVMGGMGTSQLPEWLLALTIVRRVAIIELPGHDEPDEPKNLVREIYNYVKSCVENPDKRFGGPIKLKSVETSSGRGEDDNTSGAELIKISEKASEGQVMSYCVYVRNTVNLAQSIDPTISVDLVRACESSMSQNPRFTRNEAQTVLVQWVLSPKLNPRAVLVLEREESKAAAAVTQALLWHWGFYDLAALVTGNAIPIPDGTIIGVDTGRLTQNQVDWSLTSYPFFQIPRDRKWQKVNITTLPPQQFLHLALASNVMQNNVSRLATLLANSAWALHCPPAIAEKITLENRPTGFMVSKYLKAQLADLVIKFKSLY